MLCCLPYDVHFCLSDLPAAQPDYLRADLVAAGDPFPTYPDALYEDRFGGARAVVRSRYAWHMKRKHAVLLLVVGVAMVAIYLLYYAALVTGSK